VLIGCCVLKFLSRGDCADDCASASERCTDVEALRCRGAEQVQSTCRGAGADQVQRCKVAEVSVQVKTRRCRVRCRGAKRIRGTEVQRF
jgi:hypothetical protein